MFNEETIKHVYAEMERYADGIMVNAALSWNYESSSGLVPYGCVTANVNTRWGIIVRYTSETISVIIKDYEAPIEDRFVDDYTVPMPIDDGVYDAMVHMGCAALLRCKR